MAHIFKTIFPRPAYRTYFNVSISIGLLVAFILIAFQPFGTANFKHDYKYLILLGYGIVVSLFLITYFYVTVNFIYKKIAHRWTIIFEVLDIFISVVLSIILCYLYASIILFNSISLNGLLSFAKVSASVALFPTLIYLAYLYGKWKDVMHSSIEVEPRNDHETIRLVGVNKNGFVDTSNDNIIYAQAQDNYILLLIENDNQEERHVLRSTLKQLKSQLNPEVFIQCHRSFIINKERVLSKNGNKSKAYLQLRGSEKQIPLSRSYFDSIA